VLHSVAVLYFLRSFWWRILKECWKAMLIHRDSDMHNFTYRHQTDCKIIISSDRRIGAYIQQKCDVKKIRTFFDVFSAPDSGPYVKRSRCCFHVRSLRCRHVGMVGSRELKYKRGVAFSCMIQSFIKICWFGSYKEREDIRMWWWRKLMFPYSSCVLKVG
jgi:hypothetical protein